jgi:uncharacterized protein (TIGR03790 family)
VKSEVPDNVQAYLLTWLDPYRVGCMSITSAFALGGYDDKYCNTTNEPCSTTAPVDYYDSESTRPWADHAIRPAMMLALEQVSEAESVIDRGVAADGTAPPGTGYFVRTSDGARSGPRWRDFERTAQDWMSRDDLEVTYLDRSDGSASNVLRDRQGVLFYLTGLTNVADIHTLEYRPGAIADHLTSFAGRLSSFGGQMSAVEWLRAGATASYGTVVEPCAIEQKFPEASVLVDHYFRGDSLLEAYWKSVAWPGEGVFIGEPLAAPWGDPTLRFEDGNLTISTTQLRPQVTYQVTARADQGAEPQVVLDGIAVEQSTRREIRVEAADQPIYELRRRP